MKKAILFFATIAFAASASAQVVYDADSHRKKIMLINAEMKDPRNLAKADMWLKKGDVFLATATAPREGLRKGMYGDDITKICGVPLEEREETVKNAVYKVMVFPNYDLYIPKGKTTVSFWIQKVTIDPNALDIACEAYFKALELNPKLESKIKPKVEKISAEYKQQADMALAVENNQVTRDAFIKAFNCDIKPVIGKTDTVLAYNVGFLSVILNDYDTAIEWLNKSREYNYYNKGEVYKLLYYAYEGKKDYSNAEKIAAEGISKFPEYSELIELLLISYSKQGKDASGLTGMLEEALKNSPNNFNMNFGLAVIYDKVKNYDKAIEYFKRSSEINPKDFGSYLNLAVSYIHKGELMIDEINAIPPSKADEYNAKRKIMESYYKEALVPLEKAYEIDPTSKDCVNLLKSFYFRFRDESPEMAAKADKYNAIWEQMK